VFSELVNCTFDSTIVREYLLKLKPKLACGVDNVPQVLFSKFADSFCVPLSMIFSASFSQSTVPSRWKISRVTPVFKKGNKHLVSNFRPISLLCPADKVMEMIVNDAIVAYLDENNLISPNQHGFCKAKSTVTQLLVTLNEWTGCVDDGVSFDAFYIDIAKAFDSIPHNLLLYKLQCYGIKGLLLDWCISYLSDRRQLVAVDNYESAILPVSSGVPQGSILGPTLFVLFMNDIELCLRWSKIKLYADDSKICYYFEKDQNCDPYNLQTDIDNICCWCDKNGLKIAYQKCSILHVGRQNPTFSYFCSGQPVATVSSVVDLGVTVSSSLKFSDHCVRITRLACQKVNLIFSVFGSHSVDLLLKLYKCYVRSRLEYASEVWSPHFVRDIELLERVQRLFTRRLPGFSVFSYEERLRRLNLASLKDRRIHRDLIMVFKILKGYVRVDSDEFFQLSPNRSTRGNDCKLVVKNCSLEIRRNFFSYRVIKYWNALPNYVVNSSSVEIFKNRVSRFDFSGIIGGRIFAAVRSAHSNPH
jgi:hypothetical protein